MAAPHRLAVVLVIAALLAAGCGDADVEGSDEVSPVETSSSTTSQPPLDLADVVAPGDQTDIVNECVADDEGTDAADTFDDAGLALAPEGTRRFEPLNDPAMVTAAEATWLDGDDIVMGILHGGEAQAFPIDQMTYHHVANTTVAGEPYLVTY